MRAQEVRANERWKTRVSEEETALGKREEYGAPCGRVSSEKLERDGVKGP